MMMSITRLSIAALFLSVGDGGAASAVWGSQPTASSVLRPPLSNGVMAVSPERPGTIPTRADELHTPAVGTPERKAIMDALRKAQEDQKVVFKVNHLKVHNGWVWVDVTPLDDKGKAVAEGGPSLLHMEGGEWKVMDLSAVPDDPDDPLGPMDPTPKYIKNLQQTFPGVPADIFPKRKK